MEELRKIWTQTLSLLLAFTLMLVPLAAPVQAASPASAPYSPELAAFLEQDWAPEGYITPANGHETLRQSEFAELLNDAADAAGTDLRFLTLSDQDTVKRETAAAILDQAVDVPYIGRNVFTDIPQSGPDASSIGTVVTSGLMKGVSGHRFGYGKPLSRSEAAVVAYRLYLYLQPFNPVEATIADIQTAMTAGRLTAEQLVELYLDRIERYDKQGPKLNSIIRINDKALEIARALDEERAKTGPRGPLHGIPVIVKDNFDTADIPTTGGSLALKDSIPPDDAFQVKKLKEAGAIILAKANLHEFAFGYTTVSSAGGQTLNPYDPTRIPGGSSGGTGAAVAASLGAVGMGTDTGGSIRVPASFNSLVGIRPTIGLSSRDGIMPLALTQDTGGPIARTVADAAAILDATVGYDPQDVTTAASVGMVPDSYLDVLDPNGLEGARIGVLREVFGTNADIQNVMEKAIRDMEAAGATIVDNVTIPNFKEINSYGSLSAWEFKFQFNDYLESLGEDRPYKTLDDILASGLFDPSVAKQLKERNDRESLDDETYKDIVLYRTRLAQQAVLKMMADHRLDALIFPTSANPIVKIGEEQTIGDGFKLSSFTGYPTVTVPAGFTPDRMPVGMDFIGRPFSEPTLIKLAYAFEQKTHHRRAPELTP